MIIAFYALGILASVFHLANGLWTMGITWGAWTSEKAQRNALVVCGVFGAGLLAVGMSALVGMVAVGSGESFEQARQIEDRMYEGLVEQGLVPANSHKRVEAHGAEKHSEVETEAKADDEG